MQAPNPHFRRTLTHWYAVLLLPFVTLLSFMGGLFLAGATMPLLSASMLDGLSVQGIQSGNFNFGIDNGSVSVGYGKGQSSGGLSAAPGCGDATNCTKPIAVDQIAFGTKIQTGLRSAILAWVNFALGFLALIATAILVYCGFRYVLAGADSGLADQAKSGILYSVLGIVVIFTAYAIVATLITAGPQGGDISPQQVKGDIIDTLSY